MATDQTPVHVARKLLGVPLFLPAFVALVLAMLAEAMGFSYIALLAVDIIGLNPLELGAFLTLSAVSGMIASTAFGHLHDHRPVVWPLLLSLLAKGFGFGLCAMLTEPWMLMLNAAVLFGISGASFSLLFAIAKSYLDGADDQLVASGMAALRMGNSLSWAFGPAMGAAIVASWMVEGVFLASAALAGLALAVVILANLKVVPSAPRREPITIHLLVSTAPIVLALTAFHTAMFSGSNAMSIIVAQEFGSQADVGLLFSPCALLEVAVMSLFVIRPAAASGRWLLLAGYVVFAAYFALPIVWPSLGAFYVGQLFRAVGIAVVSIVGMAYLQDLLPGRAGVAAALFGNSASAGLLLSGVATGLWADQYGYMSLFPACGVLCLAGALLLCIRGGTYNAPSR